MLFYDELITNVYYAFTMSHIGLLGVSSIGKTVLDKTVSCSKCIQFWKSSVMMYVHMRKCQTLLSAKTTEINKMYSFSEMRSQPNRREITVSTI
jgi:hypothetical protein